MDVICEPERGATPSLFDAEMRRPKRTRTKIQQNQRSRPFPLIMVWLQVESWGDNESDQHLAELRNQPRDVYGSDRSKRWPMHARPELSIKQLIEDPIAKATTRLPAAARHQITLLRASCSKAPLEKPL
jgi:hypothetical protein